MTCPLPKLVYMDHMPAGENVTTGENMDIGEVKSVTTADKNLSTDIDATADKNLLTDIDVNDWYAIEKRLQSSKS